MCGVPSTYVGSRDEGMLYPVQYFPTCTLRTCIRQQIFYNIIPLLPMKIEILCVYFLAKFLNKITTILIPSTLERGKYRRWKLSRFPVWMSVNTNPQY